MPPIPLVQTVLDGVATTSAPLFTELLPWGLMGAGFLIGGLIVYGIINWAIGGIGNAIHGGKEKYE